MSTDPWENLETEIPQPGIVPDTKHGIDGHADQQPTYEPDEETHVNDDFDEDDGDDDEEGDQE